MNQGEHEIVLFPCGITREVDGPGSCTMTKALRELREFGIVCNTFWRAGADHVPPRTTFVSSLPADQHRWSHVMIIQS